MMATVLVMGGLTSCSSDDNGNQEPTGQVLQDGTCDIVVNGRLAGLAASKRLTLF